MLADMPTPWRLTLAFLIALQAGLSALAAGSFPQLGAQQVAAWAGLANLVLSVFLMQAQGTNAINRARMRGASLWQRWEQRGAPPAPEGKPKDVSLYSVAALPMLATISLTGFIANIAIPLIVLAVIAWAAWKLLSVVPLPATVREVIYVLGVLLLVLAILLLFTGGLKVTP